MKKKTKSKSKVSKKKSKKSRNVDSSVLDHVDKLNAVIRETMSFNLICGLNAAFASDPRARFAVVDEFATCWRGVAKT